MGGVCAVYVEGGIGFGEASVLGVFEGLGVGSALLNHFGEDEVGCSVYDSVEGVGAVGGEAVDDGSDDGDAAGAGGFESDAAVVFSGEGEEGGAVMGQERLVGGDNVFSGFEGLFDDGACRRESADGFHYHANLRIGQYGGEIVVEK